MSYPGPAAPEPTEPQPPHQPDPTGYEPAPAYQQPHTEPVFPVTGPTAPMPPVGSAPPMSGPPMSGPPMSGPPMAGPPGYGMPGFAPATAGFAPATAVPAPVPAPRRGSATVLFAILTAVLFFVAAVFTTLYITKSSAYNKQVATVRQRDRTIADDANEVQNLRQQLQSTKDQLNDARQQQSGTQSQLDEITREKQVIADCLNLYDKEVTALLNNDKTTFNANAKAMQSACDEASKYVD